MKRLLLIVLVSAAHAQDLPKDVYPDSLSRLPLIKREALDEKGKKLYDVVVSPEARSLAGLQGPMGIWLYSPLMAEHQRPLNYYLRFETDLPRRLTELAILVTAREMDSQFEWTAHEAAALMNLAALMGDYASTPSSSALSTTNYPAVKTPVADSLRGFPFASRGTILWLAQTAASYVTFSGGKYV